MFWGQRARAIGYIWFSFGGERGTSVQVSWRVGNHPFLVKDPLSKEKIRNKNQVYQTRTPKRKIFKCLKTSKMTKSLLHLFPKLNSCQNTEVSSHFSVQMQSFIGSSFFSAHPEFMRKLWRSVEEIKSSGVSLEKPFAEGTKRRVLSGERWSYWSRNLFLLTEL
jgi:hypothetical protein